MKSKATKPKTVEILYEIGPPVVVVGGIRFVRGVPQPVLTVIADRLLKKKTIKFSLAAPAGKEEE